MLCRLAPQALTGAAWVGSCSVVQCVGRLIDQPLCCAAADADVWGEDMVMAPTATCNSVSPCFHGCLAFLHGISHHSLLPHIPSIRLSAFYSSPCSGSTPQSLNSSCQPLHIREDQRSCHGYLLLWQGLSNSHPL